MLSLVMEFRGKMFIGILKVEFMDRIKIFRKYRIIMSMWYIIKDNLVLNDNVFIREVFVEKWYDIYIYSIFRDMSVVLRFWKFWF